MKPEDRDKKKQKRRTTKSKKARIEIRAGKPETRSYKSTRLEVRKAADGSMQLVGTAIVFDSPSQDMGFTEIVKYQAVQKSLQRNSDVYMLWQHDSSQPLSRVKTGSLKLTLTDAGLDFVATLRKSPLGQNAYQAVSDGTVDSVSFGFSIADGGDKWLADEQGNVVRELWDINVSEISPVTWACYLAPHVDTRSCPVALRSKLKLKRDSDDDLDDDQEGDDNEDGSGSDSSGSDEGCQCTCAECEAGDCEDCTNPDCADDSCEDCPMQTRAAHLDLLLRRLRS